MPRQIPLTFFVAEASGPCFSPNGCLGFLSLSYHFLDTFSLLSGLENLHTLDVILLCLSIDRQYFPEIGGTFAIYLGSNEFINFCLNIWDREGRNEFQSKKTIFAPAASCGGFS